MTNMDLIALKEKLTEISTLFYQEKIEKGMQIFMAEIAKAALVPEFSPYINPLFDAVEARDYVLAADILYYEMIKRMEQ